MTSRQSPGDLPSPESPPMKRRSAHGLLASIFGAVIQIVCAGNGNAQPPADCVIVPALTNAVQFRLYTNASPTASHLFNTFDLVAYGQSWLAGPAGEPLKQWLAQPKPVVSLHNILVDGQGPVLSPTNGMSIVEQASGAEWRYVSLDATAAYRDQLQDYRRGVLFIQPDLIVVHDHLVARKPVKFQMLLHAPS